MYKAIKDIQSSYMKYLIFLSKKFIFTNSKLNITKIIKFKENQPATAYKVFNFKINQITKFIYHRLNSTNK